MSLPTPNVGPVVDWLGLGPIIPTGLHGRQRGKLVRRHTAEGVGGVYFHQAIAATYERHREAPLLHLLRPQQLDDNLWRSVYAIMAKGGPVMLGSMIRNLALLTGDDRKVARATAEMLFKRVLDHHRGVPSYRSPDDRFDRATTVQGVPDTVPTVMGRPPKPESERAQQVKITLPPDLAELLRADPDGPSAAVARMLRARRQEDGE